MMKNILSTLLLSCMITPALIAQVNEKVLTAWGDQGNGTYINPVLNADYSDPDAIRVGDKYYMVASDFHFMGMQVLESSDLVNWTLIAQLYDRLDFPKWDTNERYAGGSWAPAIRYHDGKYWVFFCTPHEGLFMTQATDPRGPWSPLHLVEKVEKWEDPCPFWDDDGQAYLGRSKHGAGPIIIHKMSPDGKRLLDEGRIVYTGPVAEGTKIHKRDGYYYLSIPEGGVERGWQTVLRSRNIYGPYEKRVVLEQGMTGVNGPHQGAMVDTPEGEWWFLHFQQFNPIGRVVHLQPMHWRDGWPVIGVDQDMNGIGEPVPGWRMPGWKPAKSKTEDSGNNNKKPNSSSVANTGNSNNNSDDKNYRIHKQENNSQSIGSSTLTIDDFNTPDLALQWQFNHNPVDDAWSLTERKGFLTLHALPAESFIKARNTLTQKSVGYLGEFTVKLNVSALKDGDHAGLACMGKTNHQLGVKKENGRLYLYVGQDEAAASDKFRKATSNELRATSGELQQTTGNEQKATGNKPHHSDNKQQVQNGQAEQKLSLAADNSSHTTGSSLLITKSVIYLRLHLDGLHNAYRFSYSYVDNDKFFTPIGESFPMRFGHWKGVRPALFCYTTGSEGGKAMFDWVKYRVKD